MKFAGCCSEALHGFWSYCGCADCDQRAVIDHRSRSAELVLVAMYQHHTNIPSQYWRYGPCIA